MSLSLHFDNRLDRLAEALAGRLARAEGHPLRRHAVVVPSLGVGRWLQQQVALRHGVAAGLEPEFAGRLLWRCLRQLMPDLPARSPFDPALVRWRLLAIFEALPEPDQLPSEAAEGLRILRERLGPAGSAHRLAVAGEVALLFERYLAWRRDWLEDWQRGTLLGRLGPHESWQAWLWRRLLASLPELASRHPYDRFEALVREDPERARASLAGLAVSVFGMPAMSPSQFGLLGLLGQVADVAFFAPDPCRELWEDLADSRTRARVLATHPEIAWLYDGEPAVLGDWGRGQRDFVAQVAALQERFGVQAHEPFRALDDPDAGSAAKSRAPDAGPLSCLQALRHAVFVRSDAPWQSVAGADDSICVHAAHGPMRQAEVLHDCLLDCFARLPGLQPSEIVVLCADIESAAPAIDAVFGSVDAPRRIPVTVSGRPPQADPLLRAALELFALAAQGPDVAAIEAWLLNPAVAEATGLSADDTVSLMRVLEGAGARWGLDPHDGAAKHSWRDAFDRLLIGSAVAGEVRLVGRLAPAAGLRGSRAEALEPLLRLFSLLGALREAAASPRPPTQWCACFGEMIERFFGATRGNAGGLARLREALAELSEAASQAPPVAIDVQAFRQALEDTLRESAPAALASGAVAVCPMGALRAVPYRVVCLFGMDEGAFPRRAARSEADLMLRSPRFGDRHPRSEERGAFLDAVLAARERLIVLFRGRDARDDTVLNPSPVVLEMLAYTRERLAVDAGEALRRQAPAAGLASCIVEHPLHPFAPRRFVGEGSYAKEWEAAARALAAPVAARGAIATALVPTSAPWRLGRAPETMPARQADEACLPAAGAANDVAAGGCSTAPAHAARSARRARALPLDGLRLALADPIAWWLRHAQGAALPPIERAIDRFEPLWPDDSGQAWLLDMVAQRLIAGESPTRLEEELRASPHTAGGAVGRRHAHRLLERATALVERAGGPAAAGAALDLEWRADCGAVVFARLFQPDSDGCQRIVSGYRLNLHGLVEAWLRHALLGSAAGVTVLATVDARVTIRLDDRDTALRHALQAIDHVLAGPPAAFPRAWLAAWREAARPARRAGSGRRTGPGGPGGGEADGAERGDGGASAPDARRLTRLAAEIAGGFRAGELARAPQAAFWRDEAPDIERALRDGDALWGPVVASARIDEEGPI